MQAKTCRLFASHEQYIHEGGSEVQEKCTSSPTASAPAKGLKLITFRSWPPESEETIQQTEFLYNMQKKTQSMDAACGGREQYSGRAPWHIHAALAHSAPIQEAIQVLENLPQHESKAFHNSTGLVVK